MSDKIQEFNNDDHETSKTEGWCISECNTHRSSCQTVERTDEHQIQFLEEADIFKTDEQAWKFVVEQALNGSDMHKRAISFMEKHNFDNIELLNMVFVKKPEKNDIPKECTRCGIAKLPDDSQFKGQFPVPASYVKWWKDQTNGWTLSIEFKRPHYYLDGVDYKRDIGKMKITNVICPSCQIKMDKEEDDIIKLIL
jgi:hypothetical protein